MPSNKARVLVVDDDVRIVRMIQRILEFEGYKAISASDGQEALEIMDRENPALVLADIMMPGMDGITLCKHIREFSKAPIVIVTARGNDDEKVEGLDAGADDYICKPFSSKELAARVKAVLRRTSYTDEPEEAPFVCQGLHIDFSSHKTTLNGIELDLTATEYRLLSYLARHAGRIVTADQILATVWDDSYIGEYDLLRVNMARLRRKLGEDFTTSKYLVTKHGIGYMLQIEEK